MKSMRDRFSGAAVMAGKAFMLPWHQRVAAWVTGFRVGLRVLQLGVSECAMQTFTKHSGAVANSVLANNALMKGFMGRK